MKASLGPTTVLTMTSAFMLVIFLVNTVEAREIKTTEIKKTENKTSKCDSNLPSWIDWRTDDVKNATARERLVNSGFKTAMVVIMAILVVLANALLCYLLFSDKNLWGQRTYKMIFSLACNDGLSGLLLGFAVVTEMESVQKYAASHFLCKSVIAGLWLCVVTSVYTFTMISVARWLMLNHPKYYTANFVNKPMWSSHLGIASCWFAGVLHAIPLLTSWNNECVTDFTTCSLPYKSPLWIWGAAIFVLFIPSLIIVVVYTLILLKMRGKEENPVVVQVTKTMSILTAAFLICWWPLGIYLSVRWNSVGGSRGFYWGAVSSLVNPVLVIYLNNQLYAKVAAMFAKLKCCKT